MDSPTLFSEADENIFLFVFISCFFSFEICIYEYFLDGVESSNKKYLLEFIKRRSKARQNNISCGSTLKFDQCGTFSENYKPIRVWI